MNCREEGGYSPSPGFHSPGPRVAPLNLTVRAIVDNRFLLVGTLLDYINKYLYWLRSFAR